MSNLTKKQNVHTIITSGGAKGYIKVTEWIQVASKKEGDERFKNNKLIANLKKIKREIEAENAQNDALRIIEILITEKEAQTLLAEMYANKNMDASFEETTTFLELFDKLLAEASK